METMKHRTFIVWFVIFLFWAFYRANFFFPEWVDEFIVKPIVFVFPVFYVVLAKEKKNLISLGFPTKLKELFEDLYIGVVVGVIFAFEGVLSNYLKSGKLMFEPIFALKAAGGVAPFLLLNFMTSVWEEILGRGYLYQRLYFLSKHQLGAAVTSSFLFLLLHIPIMFTRLHLTGTSFLIYPISIMLLGITNSYILSWRKTLSLPILIHAFWNMTVALYL